MTSPIAAVTVASKRDMWAPFCFGPRSTKHSSRAQKSCSRTRMTFSTPVTPTRERETWTVGRWDWTSGEPEATCMQLDDRPIGPGPKLWYHLSLSQLGDHSG